MDEFELISTLAGLFLLGLGYLVKVKKKMSLIAGYSEEAVADQDGLASWVGSNVIFLSIVILLAALLHRLIAGITLPLAVACALIILVDIAVTVRGSMKYLHGFGDAPTFSGDPRELKPSDRSFNSLPLPDDAELIPVNSPAKKDEQPERFPRAGLR